MQSATRWAAGARSVVGHAFSRRHGGGSAWLSSLAEPTLFPAITVETASAAAANAATSGGGGDSLLWSDVRTMGTMIGESISTHNGEDVLMKVETMRKMARKAEQRKMRAD